MFTLGQFVLFGLVCAVVSAFASWFFFGKTHRDKAVLALKAQELEEIVEKAIRDRQIDQEEYEEIRDKSIELIEEINK